jgi:hypothetical protein
MRNSGKRQMSHVPFNLEWRFPKLPGPSATSAITSELADDPESGGSLSGFTTTAPRTGQFAAIAPGQNG